MELNKHHYSLERVKCGLYKNLEQFSLMKMRTCKPISKRFKSMNSIHHFLPFSPLTTELHFCRITGLISPCESNKAGLQKRPLLLARTEACGPLWTETHKLYLLLCSLQLHNWRLAYDYRRLASEKGHTHMSGLVLCPTPVSSVSFQGSAETMLSFLKAFLVYRRHESLTVSTMWFAKLP